MSDKTVVFTELIADDGSFTGPYARLSSRPQMLAPIVERVQWNEILGRQEEIDSTSPGTVEVGFEGHGGP